ncbi:MAG: PEPxxWA-CTERM sorting domain-containing protein [Phenylobacterium sp.]|uniref:PEPxxWA-CTERM sorting domain-containing protein n=1 Tax=Phenylobacterium sp. TaxID=1871053 RepID=UPI001A535A6E|nr:PEPxxWA-CTERM sorting domain-containing protein [Phenylobacterium sp.]MBL8554188.1 PEPxxWA-CTERM sorting domain-containing protein [Phenylobacterium sp.]
MKFFAGLVGALALASTAQAVTYDAFTSFDGTQGAGGFSYVKLPAGPGQPASLLTAPANCVVTADSCLQDGGSLPGVYKSDTAFNEGTYMVPDDRLLVHPGVSNPIAIFFTAPTAGVYDWDVTFSILDRSPSGVALASLTNVSGAPVATPLGFLNTPGAALSRSGTISLAQGQFFAVIVNAAGSYSNDSTGVNFTLTSAGVPEPGAWALMILGFGGAGAMLRRRLHTLGPVA